MSTINTNKNTTTSPRTNNLTTSSDPYTQTLNAETGVEILKQSMDAVDDSMHQEQQQSSPTATTTATTIQSLTSPTSSSNNNNNSSPRDDNNTKHKSFTTQQRSSSGNSNPSGKRSLLSMFSFRTSNTDNKIKKGTSNEDLLQHNHNNNNNRKSTNNDKRKSAHHTTTTTTSPRELGDIFSSDVGEGDFSGDKFEMRLTNDGSVFKAPEKEAGAVFFSADSDHSGDGFLPPPSRGREKYHQHQKQTAKGYKPRVLNNLDAMRSFDQVPADAQKIT
jgi:hypothetical protein